MSVSAARRLEVRSRANGVCEYCHLSDYLIQAGSTFNVEHVYAIVHWAVGDADVDEAPNLAWACWLCNRSKGHTLEATEPSTGVAHFLFNPRFDQWPSHFVPSPSSGRIDGLPGVGAATVAALRMNEATRTEIRAIHARLGTWPIEPSAGLPKSVLEALSGS
jgi:hypothetical protein